jgi:hypothetical protein
MAELYLLLLLLLLSRTRIPWRNRVEALLGAF